LDQEEQWPDLTLSRWEDTRDTLQLWAQIVGKVRLTLEPMINHWWQVPLYVSARGLTTSLMHSDVGGLEIEFDFVHHVLELRTSAGDLRHIPLEPQTVASFYHQVTGSLESLGLNLTLFGRPVEVPISIPFAQDDQHRSYDAAAAHAFWLALLQAHRVMTVFRGRFIGKASPVHFFWGAADLATSRFSGRRAPKHRGGVPNCPDLVQELAYSHEVSSCGFWPGGSAEGSFYAYAYPQPDGFDEWQVGPEAAYYDKNLGEFLLPYGALRVAEAPDSMLLEFFQTTYEAAAELAGWDRAELEIDPGR
jgi:hypothetical protein